MKTATFSLLKYSFDKVSIDYSLKESDNKININFEPRGIFTQKIDKSIYKLTFIFSANNNENTQPFVEIECNAIFSFAEPITFENIPIYFYGNSIAILFPYIRAFISTVTLQANHSPLVIPTMNLSSLEEPLRKNTTIEQN